MISRQNVVRFDGPISGGEHPTPKRIVRWSNTQKTVNVGLMSRGGDIHVSPGLTNTRARVVAHAFGDRVLGDVPSCLASPEFRLPQRIAVQFLYDPAELRLGNGRVDEVMEHVPLVGCYVLLMARIGPLTLLPHKCKMQLLIVLLPP